MEMCTGNTVILDKRLKLLVGISVGNEKKIIELWNGLDWEGP